MLILRALYSLSIVEVAISVCNFDIQKTGQDWMNIMNHVRLLTQLGSCSSSKLHIPAKLALT
jgi:hypothetical protein